MFMCASLDFHANVILVFMVAQTLVPPTASPMLRNGTPSSLGGVPSSSTYDDPFAF